MLFDIDWQGTRIATQVSLSAPGDIDEHLRAAAVPATASSSGACARAQDEAKIVIRGASSKAAGEISHWPEYDYVIVNDDIDVAHAKILSILMAERLKRARQIGLSDFVRELIGSG